MTWELARNALTAFWAADVYYKQMWDREKDVDLSFIYPWAKAKTAKSRVLSKSYCPNQINIDRFDGDDLKILETK